MIENQPIFQYINMTLACLSIAGCLFIIIIFLLYKSIRSFAMEQVIYLTFSCLITTISYILQALDPEKVRKSGEGLSPDELLNICKIQSFLMVWFENSQFISATLIAFTIYRSVIFSEEIITGKTQSRRIIYLLTIYFCPFVFSLIGLLSFSVFGPSDFWCFIKIGQENHENNTDNIIFYSLNYTVFWILIGLNFYFNIKIIYFIRKELINNENEVISAQNYIRKLAIFPIIQTLLLIPGTINRFTELILNKNITALMLIQVTAACSSGFIYSIVYGLNNQIKALLLNSFNKFFRRNEYQLSVRNNNFINDDSSSNLNNSLHHLDNRISFIGERGSL